MEPFDRYRFLQWVRNSNSAGLFTSLPTNPRSNVITLIWSIEDDDRKNKSRQREIIQTLGSWMVEHNNLSEETVKKIAMLYGHSQLAAHFGATRRDLKTIRQALWAEGALKKLARSWKNPSAKQVQDTLATFEELMQDGYDLSSASGEANILAIAAMHKVPGPILDFLYQHGLDPRSTKGPIPGLEWESPLDLAGSSQYEDFMMEKWIQTQKGRAETRLAELRQFERASDSQVAKPHIKRIVYDAMARELCDKIADGEITPAELIGLAELMGIEDAFETPWSDLCDVVKAKIKSMPL